MKEPPFLSMPTLPRGESPRSRPPVHPSTVVAAVLAAALVLLTTILVLNHGSLPITGPGSSGNPLLIYIDGIDRNVSYRGGWTGYAGPQINDSCTYCPVGAQAGGAIRIPIATWDLPLNSSFWVFTNVSGSFLVQSPGCSGAGCAFPWVKTWTYETYFSANSFTSVTLFATFQLPNQSPGPPNIVSLNASFCPGSICTSAPP